MSEPRSASAFMIIRSLSTHAHYACRHSGACCTAGWPIPVEPDRFLALERAAEGGLLRARSPHQPLWLRPVEATPDQPPVLSRDDQGCVFHEADRGCGIHRVLGHGALPLACRQFPRVSVIDPRGASVTLSHYCPTVADLAETASTIHITDQPAAFPAGAEVVGLDARTGLPPLLRPDMLMDWESWWDWERRAIEVIARASSMTQALAVLGGAVERARGWTPGKVPLAAHVDAAFRAAPAGAVFSRSFPAVYEDVLSAIPEELRPAAPPRADTSTPAVVRAFLAAHAFANWTAHLGQGLRSWLRSVEAAGTLAQTLGVRQADLLLRHLADPAALAEVWSRAEHRG